MKSEKAKMPAAPRGGHFEAADNGGYMLSLHQGTYDSPVKTVHASKKEMLKHMDAALPSATPKPPRKPMGNLIRGPKC